MAVAYMLSNYRATNTALTSCKGPNFASPNVLMSPGLFDVGRLVSPCHFQQTLNGERRYWAILTPLSHSPVAIKVRLTLSLSP